MAPIEDHQIVRWYKDFGVKDADKQHRGQQETLNMLKKNEELTIRLKVYSPREYR